MKKIDLYDGKYTLCIPENGGMFALRYGEEWRDLTGDGLILSLAQKIEDLEENASKVIFVFGSNEAGRHGKGAAKFALKNHGAIYGQGVGLQGNSYAIPTKDKNLNVLSLDQIEVYIEKFLEFAKDNSQLTFKTTPIGTGLAGYSKKQIMNIFRKFNISDNVTFTKEWFGK